ncbi:MAG TPA: hypothetical protein VK172_02890 [Lentimicrobium sp.]|nr:hypothetical protein [Lentimicrobium sp.]
MKKWNLLLSMLFISSAIFVTSCSKDETATGPSLSLKGGATYTSTDKTIQVEDPILVGVTGTSGDANLTRFKFSITSNNVATTILDSTFNSANFNYDQELTFTSVGEARLLFELWDKDGNKDEKSFNITVEDAGMQVVKYSNVELGSWNDAVGSFYSSTENIVYTRGQLTTSVSNQAKIDFLFFKGTTNGNTIASPDDTDANTINDLQLNLWTNKNQTRFNTTDITVAQFDAITTSFQFPVFQMGSQTTKVNNLTEGQVVMFKTESGKLGLIKVVDLYSRGDLAKVDVVVQQ